MTETADKVRIDKWLWAARFFKTRTQASHAVQGGKVRVNGARVRAARLVGIDDQLTIQKFEQVFSVTILGVSTRRGPATEARLLYEESPESVKAREEQREIRRLIRAPGVAPAKRPGKRDRRKIREFIKKN